MQLDLASRAKRAARALRFADCDAKVPFRTPKTAGGSAYVDLDDAALRGKRLSWAQFYATTDREPPAGFVPQYRPANDNRPQTPRSVPDRAAQRAQVDASMKACEDAIAAHKARIVERFKGAGAPSTPDRLLNALQKHDPATARAFLRLRELVRPPLVAANDNFSDPDIDDGSRSWGLERVHNQSCMKPSPGALIAAYERGVALGIQYFKPQKPGERFRTWVGGRVEGRFIGVLINHGEHGAVYYGDKKGRRRTCRYEDGVLTERKLEPNQEAEELQLAMAGLSSYIALNRGPVLRGFLEESYRIGARRVQRYSSGVASYQPTDYGRLGGISAFKGTGEGGTHHHAMAELAEYDRADTASDFMNGLPAADRTVMENMLVADSFSEVATAAGKEATAHNGKRAVLAVLEKYSEKIAA